jgi:hypothetical protein
VDDVHTGFNTVLMVGEEPEKPVRGFFGVPYVPVVPPDVATTNGGSNE